MIGVPGTAQRAFGALREAGVSVMMISQGSAPSTPSAAVPQEKAQRGAKWCATPSRRELEGGQIQSVELVTRTSRSSRWSATAWRALRASPARSSTRSAAPRSTCAPSRRAARSATSRSPLDLPADLDRFTSHVQAEHLPHALIVDCSASDAVAARYADWLSKGIHIATPNKHAGSGPLARYEAIKKASTRGRFRAESTVGAGLPVITTLRDLLDTGDQVLAIEGIFSGTLAWLFNTYDGTTPFSALVGQARQLGYTEPDPRDDLSGTDVARKLVILARESGWKTTLDTVKVESLVPASLQGVTPAEFLTRLSELDAPMQARLAAAKKNGNVLRYVAKLEGSGTAQVGLMELPTTHAFAHIKLTDNVVQFTTARYRNNPLVVQGPGAGPEVTAAGIFADVLRIAASLGARL
jgi:aspartokinase/homoserine dehydrogenase 1